MPTCAARKPMRPDMKTWFDKRSERARGGRAARDKGM